MIKKTLYFENPAYLSISNSQLIIKIPEIEKNLTDRLKDEFVNSIPVEDIGVVILDNQQITVTQKALQTLCENNCTVIICDANRMPLSLITPLTINTLQGERYKHQIDASLPLKKQLWQQTIQAKIRNQANLLHEATGEKTDNMQKWISDVKSGDSSNIEARAAIYYWSNIFSRNFHFLRDRYGAPPNNLLNYGYSILRAIIARAIVATGLLPSLGIHHKNRYNSFALADDIMEPFRPYVDEIVLEIVNSGVDIENISKNIKLKLLELPAIDVKINGLKRPLLIAASITTASLYKCYSLEEKKIVYPEF